MLGLISWLVTRWRLGERSLRVDSGLIRRTSERFPLSQIQAIDTVRPGLARIFGLAELRIRSGQRQRQSRPPGVSDERGGGSAARSSAGAESRHGRGRRRAPREQALLTVRAWAAVRLDPAERHRPDAGADDRGAGGARDRRAELQRPRRSASAPWALFGLVVGLFRRFNGDYRLTVADAADGLRLRSGLVETSAETIPRGRIQAIRMIEPLAWRPCGWCRLEVDVASQKSKGRQDRNQAKAGAGAAARWAAASRPPSLLAKVFPDLPTGAPRAAARARWKSPLRFRLPVLGGQRALRRHDQRAAAARDRLGAAGEGAEHPPGRGTDPASPGAREHPSRHRREGRSTPCCATGIATRRRGCLRSCQTSAVGRDGSSTTPRPAARSNLRRRLAPATF